METAAALHGDPRLVSLATQFNLKNQTDGLLEIVAGPFGNEVRDRALAFLLLNENDSNALVKLHENAATRTLLARNGSTRALDFLLPILQESDISSNERQNLVNLLCTKKKTSEALLKMVLESPSPNDSEIALYASQTLAQTPWTELMDGFLALIPPSANSEPVQQIDLPALLAQSGNVVSGRQIFRSPEFTCVNCHVAEKVGNDFGPGLSEIGKKLGKDALYDAILNPSAGISFDYEGWNITLNSGDEITGIVLSRTETHWSVKNLLGQIQEIPIADIFEKQKMSTSLMPAGLGALLGPEKLVDLVAYLSTLGK